MTPPTATATAKKSDLHLAAARQRLPIGEVLIRSGALTQEQLQEALKQQKNGNKQRLGRLLRDAQLCHRRSDAAGAQLAVEHPVRRP